MIPNWSAKAFNQVPDAVNEIHGDQVAKEYGFKGALVPGATVAAYLIHPFVEAYGMRYLESGYAHVRLHSPVYDGETFEVEVKEQAPASFSARLSQGKSNSSASAEIHLDTDQVQPPIIRGDEEGDRVRRLHAEHVGDGGVHKVLQLRDIALVSIIQRRFLIQRTLQIRINNTIAIPETNAL